MSLHLTTSSVTTSLGGGVRVSADIMRIRNDERTSPYHDRCRETVARMEVKRVFVNTSELVRRSSVPLLTWHFFDSSDRKDIPAM